MKKPQFDENLIADVLAESDGGRPVADLAEAYGVSDVTLYKWRRQYAGLEPDGIRLLRTLKDENRTLRRTLAALEQDNCALKGLLEKKP